MTDSTNTGRRRLRVLLSAYACEPGRGSEPGIGWNCAREVSVREEVWVLTRANNRGAIEKTLAEEPLPHAHFVYLDLPRWVSFWKSGSRGLRLYYYIWQAIAYPKVTRLHQQLHFDLIHHVTFGTYVFPSFLSWLPVPFVWGPVGGGETVPKSLAKSFGARRRFEELLRNVRRMFGEWDPFVKQTIRQAALIAATTEQSRKRIAGLACHNATVTTNAALCEHDVSRLLEVPRKVGGPFRVFSVGRMVQYKGFDLGLRAFALLLRSFPESEYWLIGDGPERYRLARLAQKLGITGHVTFLGALQRSEVFDRFARCDVMLFPSLHDSGGWASVEAMAAGRPVVCLDLGGPGLQIADDRGIKVVPLNAEQVVADLAAALIRLASNPTLRANMGQAAQSHVQKHHNWSHIVERFDDTYHRLARVTHSVASDTTFAESNPEETAEITLPATKIGSAATAGRQSASG